MILFGVHSSLIERGHNKKCLGFAAGRWWFVSLKSGEGKGRV